MKLKYKVPLSLFVAFAVIIVLIGTFFMSGSTALREKSQFEMGQSIAHAKSQTVQNFFDVRISELHLFESEIIAVQSLSDEQKNEILSASLCSLSNRSSAVSNVYVVFERGAYFSEKLTDSGTYYNLEAFHPDTGGLELFIDESYEVDYEDDDWYTVPKETEKLHLTEPYKWTYPNETRERTMITLSMPIFIDGKFIGVAGIDMDLVFLQRDLFTRMKDERTGSYAILVSHEGLRAVHPNEKMLLVEIGHDMAPEEQKALKNAIRNGEHYRVVKKNNQTGEISMITYAPMLPTGIDLPWSLGAVYSLTEWRAEGNRQKNQLLFIGGFSAVLWGIFLLIFMSSTFGRVTKTVKVLNNMAAGDGDLTIRLDERGKDEFAEMAKGLNGLMQKLHTTVSTTQRESKNLLGVSSTLYDLAKSISDTSKAALKLSNSASQASTSASEDVHSIASGTEEASAAASDLTNTAQQMDTNMNSVTDAMRDINDQFARIGNSVNESKIIAAEATDKATNATKVIGELSKMANEIGKVTDVIKDIAQKTSLLAINATVEAARAGEAGKGFSVVAGEVKNLATQSSASADDINVLIENIQEGTQRTANVIKGITDTIAKISDSVACVVTGIETQKSRGNEVASIVQRTSEGAKHVVEAVNEVAKSLKLTADGSCSVAEKTSDVSSNIQIIHKDAQKTSDGSAKLEEAAANLRVLARDLDSIVSKFKT